MNKLYLLLILFFSACAPEKKNEITVVLKDNIISLPTPKLSLRQIEKLISAPIECINLEYPNQLNQVLGSKNDLKEPKDLHPAFYGCYDWHSSVHNHWGLIKILKQFPNIKNSFIIKENLLDNISKENIEKEIAYFLGKDNTSFERLYGWAWLLKLAEELYTWDDETGIELSKNLEPLTDLIVKKYINFLPKLQYPNRSGEHTNTAFALAFAWDYANTVNNTLLKSAVEKRSLDFYLQDTYCPLSWEPSGYDFISPCLQEASVMKRILPKEKFKFWLSNFLPELKNKNFSIQLAKVSDRSDGKLVHLDGVNFSRAWLLNKIIKDLPEYKHLRNIAIEHVNYSLPSVVADDGYEGGHWLGTFAIHALNSFEE